MEQLLLEIIDSLKESDLLTEKQLEKIIYKHNRNLKDNKAHFAKKRLLPYYLKVKENHVEQWSSWGVDETLESKLIAVLRVKPRRTASGVATITVITKPWKCSNNCAYCPNDLRMPKSYLSDEPACQRAERNYFDPYLQVASRLRALTHMGHDTEKIELIILGGTWNDYPKKYQIWYVRELFRALNDTPRERDQNCQDIRLTYKECNITNDEESLLNTSSALQDKIDLGALSYNEGIEQLYANDGNHKKVADGQISDFDELELQHDKNETAQHRVVGLVVETRPDTICPESLLHLRRLGCTKIQMGIQSLDAQILSSNNRSTNLACINSAFELLRLFGFKIHVHFMLNLLGSTCEKDKEDYLKLVSENAYKPDEIKLYPCSLITGTQLCEHFSDNSWSPYSEDELLEILTANVLATPPFVRISRMIRDISAHDIVAGNKKANLRQMVEAQLANTDACIQEIRYREINSETIEPNNLVLKTHNFKTTVTLEYFIEWVTAENKIAGFLRLSLPMKETVRCSWPQLPPELDEAMIREVHVYGKAARLHTSGEGVQHTGLGRQLIDAAVKVASEHGYSKINVISSIGTREYYRSLGFVDNGLYQQMKLSDS